LALLGNRTVYQKSLATFRNGTNAAGVAFASQVLNNYTNSGTNRNIYSHMDKFNSDPNGMQPPYTWVIAQTDGGLASYGRINGFGFITSQLASGINVTANLSGIGQLTNADLAVIIAIIATIAGTGSINSPSLNMALGLSATLAGTGVLSNADMDSIVGMIATLVGNGSLTGSMIGLCDISANISPFTVLSPESLAISLLDQNDIETNLSVREALRVIAAAVGGKLSGAAGTTITIRNAVADDKNRITATVDANGNRTAVTYDLSNS
jgi:hypothetical protein